VRLAIEVAGRPRAVEISGARGRYQVVLDGRARSVDATRIGGTWSLLIGAAEAGPHAPSDVGAGFSRPGRSHEVTISPQAGGDLVVHVNGRPVPVSVGPSGGGLDWRRGRRERRRRESAADGGAGPQRVVAPMPGRIVSVLVKPGDAVTARQGLVVVEAMKMENELRASRAGVVTEVRAVQGSSVEANAVLVVIE